MQVDSSCEMFARPPKRQERDGWIWRLHGAMNGMRTASRHFTEFLAGILTEHMGFKRGKLERCLFTHESSETRVVSHVDDPLICAKPATLEKFWTQIKKLVVIKRGEALSPRIPVVYLGFEYRSVHDGDRRGFRVKPTANYVDECLDIVQLQNAKAVMTPLTEQKSLNLHDETTVRSSSTFIVQSCWKTAVHYRSETKSDVHDKRLVVQTSISHTCRSDTCHESAEIFEKDT